MLHLPSRWCMCPMHACQSLTLHMEDYESIYEAFVLPSTHWLLLVPTGWVLAITT
jgi:hypothetical protein